MKKTIKYNRIGELSNGAVIYEPLCNISHKYCIDSKIEEKSVGILIEAHKNEEGWYGTILSVYKDCRNYFSVRYTKKYQNYVDSCIKLMSESNFIR